MKKTLYIFILFPFFIFGQDSGVVKNNEQNITKSSIYNQFSKVAVVAYQNQAEATIADFYNYINLYANSNSELNQEIDLAIYNLFLNNSILVEDIFNENSSQITLLQFVKKCKENKATITILNFEEKAVSDNYFTFNYQISVGVKNQLNTIDLLQKVYFFPSEKQFGTEKKTVWQLKLGEM